MLSHSELLLRIAAGAALGGIIGVERGRHRRPVGLRTHLLVALASSTFMVVSTQFAYYQNFARSDGIDVDASRIAASVVSAVGFLAGGAILRSGISVQGLTTAAGLWLVTAIGLCAGSGMYVVSVSVTALGLVALTLFRRLEDKTDVLTQRRISVILAEKTTPSIESIMKALSDLGAVVVEVEYERHLDERPHVELVLDVRLPLDLAVPTLIGALEPHPGVERIKISQPT